MTNKDLISKAVNRNGGAIKYIDNPSEEVQLVAVSRNHKAFNDIKSPSGKVKELYYKLKKYEIIRNI